MSQSFFIYLILLIFLPLGVCAYLLRRGLRQLEGMTTEEVRKKISRTRPFFDDYHDIIIVPAVNFWATRAYPFLLSEAEKVISRARIIVLKTENHLLRFRDYVRGKRRVNMSAGGNGGNQYWNEVNGFKTKNGGGKIYD